MKKARGYSIITDPAMPRPEETETFTCCHCQQIVDKPPFVAATDEAIGAWCTCCDAPMCKRCIGKPCRPIEKWLEQQETRRSYADVMRCG
jgi:hypothetical protein